MYHAYKCQACGNVIRATDEPRDCPRCESRLFRDVEDAPVKQERKEPEVRLPRDQPSVLLFPPVPLPRQGITAFAASYGLSFCFMAFGLLAVVAVDWRHGLLLEKGLIVGGLFLVGVGLSILASVLALMKLYAAWRIVQPLRGMNVAHVNMPTPGKAVGFLFIPLFNLYWMFVAWVGIAKKMNEYFAVRGIAARPLSVGLAIAVCVVSLIPVVNIAAAVLFFILIVELNRGINAAVSG